MSPRLPWRGQPCNKYVSQGVPAMLRGYHGLSNPSINCRKRHRQDKQLVWDPTACAWPLWWHSLGWSQQRFRIAFHMPWNIPHILGSWSMSVRTTGLWIDPAALLEQPTGSLSLPQNSPLKILGATCLQTFWRADWCAMLGANMMLKPAHIQ